MKRAVHIIRQTVWHSIPRKSSEESGQGLAEYALILALIALACITALTVFGQAIADSVGFKLFQ